MESKQESNRTRYKLHRQIRKEGYRLNTKERTVYVFYKNTQFTEILIKLRDKFGYSIQSELHI